MPRMRSLVLMLCAAVLAAATDGHATNELEVVQTTVSPCATYGGGPVIAVSPDGLHAYEFGFPETLYVSSRDVSTGALTPMQAIGPPTVPSITNVVSIALSPDGEHVYLGSHSHGITVLDRDTLAGTVSFVQALPPDGRSVAVSPDGLHVLHHEDDALVVYERDPGTGMLTFLEQHAIPGLDEMAMTPDGAHVYTTSSAATVHRFARNAGTGALTLLGTMGVPGARAIAASPDGSSVYVVQLTSSFEGQLTTFSRDAGSGALTAVDAETDDDPGLSGLVGATLMALSEDGEHVYLTANSTSFGHGVLVFDRSTLDGSLTFVEQHLDQTGGLDGLDPANHVAVSPDGAHVYVIGEGTVVFERDAATGALLFLQNRERELLPSRATAVATSGDGRHVYRLCPRAVATFDRDLVSGVLTQTGNLTLGPNVDEATDLSMPPDGEHIYVAGSSIFVVIDRDPATGALGIVTEHDPIPSSFHAIRQVAISPDGRNLYVSNTLDSGFWVLTRDPSTGLLSSLESHGGAVLHDVQDLLVSPDGAHVYVGTYDRSGQIEPDGIVIYARDPVTGALTFGTFFPVGGGGGGGLDGIHQLALGAGGARLYASGDFASGGVGGVSVYTRDPATGLLAFQSSLRQGTPAADALVDPIALDVHPDGTYVYATGASRLQVLRTDVATGGLGFVHVTPGVWVNDRYVVDEILGADGRAAQSPDGTHVYAVEPDGDVVVLGRRAACSAMPAVGCTAPDKTALKVLDKIGTRDLVTWKWKAPGSLAAGDPLTTTGFALCVYDASADPQPVIDGAVAPGGTCGTKPCWSGDAAGHKYVDKVGTPDGVAKIRLLSGTGTAKIVLKGKGASLPPLGLPYVPPVTVQLQATNGECWEASYATPTIGDAAQFKAVQ